MTTLSRTRFFRNISELISDKTLTKKAYLNAFASILEYATSLLVGFFLTPFIVSGLGDYSFGLWQVLNRLVGYLTPASGRPTFALKWTLANQQSSDDYEKKRRYVGSTLIIWALFLPLMLILGGIVAWFVPTWIKAPAPFVWTIRIVSIVLVANMIIDTLTNVPQAVLQGQNLGYKRMGMSAGLVIAGGVLTWLAVYLKLGIVGVGISALLETVLSGFFFLTIVRNYASWFGAAKPFNIELHEMLGRSWWFMGWNLVTTGLLASDVVVLGLFNSIVSVTSYTLTKYVPEMMISIIANVVFAIMPGLGGIIGSGDLKRAIRLRGEIMSLVWLVVTAMGSSVLLWNRSFLGLWVGIERYSGSLAHLLIVIGVMQLVFIRSDATIIDLTLRLSQKVLLGLVSVTVSVVTASVLVSYFKMGIVGLCLGIMLGRLILTFGYPLLISRFLGIPVSAQLKALVRPMLVSIILFGGAVAVDAVVPTITWPGAQHWIGFFLFAGLTGVIMVALSFFVGLTSEQRAVLVGRVRMLYSHTDNTAQPLEK
jgi:O-antigen/teichoic acid export membrane protein